jgi:hypothetical protein
MERDWPEEMEPEEELSDVDDVVFGLMHIDGRKKAMTILRDAIIRLARGDDVSPEMRECIAGVLECEQVQLTPAPEYVLSIGRDAVIAAELEDQLRELGKAEAAYQAAADIFGVTPRSIQRGGTSSSIWLRTTPTPNRCRDTESRSVSCDFDCK